MDNEYSLQILAIPFSLKYMPRKKKIRYCQKYNGPNAYKPAGIPMSDLPVTELDLDELEAMRLCDSEELDQSRAAEQMNISRGTLQRLLYSGRKKVIESLLNSRALSIEKRPHTVQNRPQKQGRRRRGRANR